jgi:hypothetical protein
MNDKINETMRGGIMTMIQPSIMGADIAQWPNTSPEKIPDGVSNFNEKEKE